VIASAIPMPMSSDQDRIRVGAGDGESSVRPGPLNLDFNLFATSEIGMPVPVIEERSGHPNSELRAPIAIRSGALNRNRPALAFADRGREKTNFGSALPWKAFDPDGLEMTRA
jgi:hypothetical protein